jgi:DNA mismatch endonuclease (patch repair protein)
MADTHSKEERSINMSHIRSKNTKPEVLVGKYLFSRGLRYRKNVSNLPGTPDFVFKKFKTVVFVNGCFWHHHDCGRFVWPSTNVEYWRNKIESNVKRDVENYSLLQEQGWKVLVIWECQLKKSVCETHLSELYDIIVRT